MQEANQARGQLECELIQETQELAEWCEHKQTQTGQKACKKEGTDDQPNWVLLST